MMEVSAILFIYIYSISPWKSLTRQHLASLHSKAAFEAKYEADILIVHSAQKCSLIL